MGQQRTSYNGQSSSNRESSSTAGKASFSLRHGCAWGNGRNGHDGCSTSTNDDGDADDCPEWNGDDDDQLRNATNDAIRAAACSTFKCSASVHVSRCYLRCAKSGQ